MIYVHTAYCVDTGRSIGSPALSDAIQRRPEHRRSPKLLSVIAYRLSDSFMRGTFQDSRLSFDPQIVMLLHWPGHYGPPKSPPSEPP